MDYIGPRLRTVSRPSLADSEVNLSMSDMGISRQSSCYCFVLVNSMNAGSGSGIGFAASGVIFLRLWTHEQAAGVQRLEPRKEAALLLDSYTCHSESCFSIFNERFERSI